MKGYKLIDLRSIVSYFHSTNKLAIFHPAYSSSVVLLKMIKFEYLWKKRIASKSISSTTQFA